MADYDSSLPVRTETKGDVAVKVVDYAGTNEWAIDSNHIGQVNLNDGTNALVIGANGEIKALISAGGNDLVVNGDGSINVNFVTALSGGEVHKYDTHSALAPNTPTTVVTYTVTAGKTMQLKAVSGCASGAFKCEVFGGLTAGTPPTATPLAVFFGSTAGGTVELTFPQPIEIPATQTVTLKFTNRDKQNMDVYGFINGVEV
jgi:hypothetical protein